MLNNPRAVPTAGLLILILEKRYGTEESLKQIETEVRAIVTEAADFATSDAEPAVSELWTDIYAA